MTVTIVGVGLIGGSLGLALARKRQDLRIIGWGRRESTLGRACELGAITGYSLDLNAAVRESDLVVLCTPVDILPHQAVQVLQHCRRDAVVTDVGSVKASIVTAVEQSLPADRAARFVGGHPLAGSELTGVEHARADLFEGKRCILTPGSVTSPAALDTAYEIWRTVGADVVLMRPDTHDRLLAATSHLPHVVATALVNALPSEAIPFVASGFLDTTRIAASSADVWIPILLHNREHILNEVRELNRQIAELVSALEAGDEARLTEWWSTAAQRRRELSA